MFVEPGRFYFCEDFTRLRTVLGSCVAMTFWHPELKIGAMSHCMLPTRAKCTGTLDGKYIDDAFELFQLQVNRHGERLQEFQLKLFGGGEMFPGQRHDLAGSNVARDNITAACEHATRLNLQPVAVDLGGAGHRNVFFDTWSGNVWVRYTPLNTAEGHYEENQGIASRRFCRGTSGIAGYSGKNPRH
ncbi:chemotaxis protein CheD (plasmid) [Pseudomonas sp. HR96]|uniref:chemotaxis protein CheD n=1 Tax=Pseudomonas sp. HR96 TaxID=1027966 RepID=UPI002A74DEFB|nr:chemotaxis protein CheD [Pseudomonas sp. HR96]WPP02480.1 chemotaxis protein CheD [Pseudomonas sp. HR96]